jgi:hypothetical protein
VSISLKNQIINKKKLFRLKTVFLFSPISSRSFLVAYDSVVLSFSYLVATIDLVLLVDMAEWHFERKKQIRIAFENARK